MGSARRTDAATSQICRGVGAGVLKGLLQKESFQLLCSTHLPDIQGSATRFGLGEGQTAHFGSDALTLEGVGCALQRYAPNAPGLRASASRGRGGLRGSGGLGQDQADEEIRELQRLDAIRVQPQVWRAFSAGPEGMEIIAFSPRHPGEGDAAADWWPDDR